MTGERISSNNNRIAWPQGPLRTGPRCGTDGLGQYKMPSQDSIRAQRTFLPSGNDFRTIYVLKIDAFLVVIVSQAHVFYLNLNNLPITSSGCIWSV